MFTQMYSYCFKHVTLLIEAVRWLLETKRTSQQSLQGHMYLWVGTNTS